jgi:hypothetical protein
VRHDRSKLCRDNTREEVPHVLKRTDSKGRSQLHITAKRSQKTVWHDLHGRATEQKAPCDFNGTIGAVVPSTVKIEPVPSNKTVRRGAKERRST